MQFGVQFFPAVDHTDKSAAVVWAVIDSVRT